MSLKTLHLKKTIEDCSNDMSGKTVIITGTTSGTGYVCARELLKLGATVFLLNRQSDRADRAFEDFKHYGDRVVPVVCDLQKLSSVKDACLFLRDKCSAIDVICFNAGIMAFEDYKTEDGYDIQIQTNVLANFMLLNELMPLLQKSASARIVNHSSMSRLGGPLELRYFCKDEKDLGGNGSEKENMSFSGPRWERYHQTKLANFVFTYLLNDQLESNNTENIISLVAHPGLAATSLITTSASVGGINAEGEFMKSAQSAEDGACGIIRACVDPSAKAGDFFGPKTWTGFAEKLKPEPHLVTKHNKDILQRAYQLFLEEQAK